MQILILSLVSALLFSPLATQQLFRRAFQWEKRQIAVDNAGITLGRADRELFKGLVASNRVLKQLELVHHGWHVCSLSPQTAAECKPIDLALERQIQLFHAQVGIYAAANWRLNRIAALAQANALQTLIPEFVRAERVPIHPKRCAVCRMQTLWEIDARAIPIESYLRASVRPKIDVGVRLWGESILDENKWDYSLEWNPQVGAWQ